MIILHGQQAPVTDPPVHQTGIDGRRQRGGDALRIPVDDFRYLREGGFQEGQQIVTFRRRQPLLSVRQADMPAPERDADEPGFPPAAGRWRATTLPGHTSAADKAVP